jgi:hypothetical protein
VIRPWSSHQSASLPTQFRLLSCTHTHASLFLSRGCLADAHTRLYGCRCGGWPTFAAESCLSYGLPANYSLLSPFLCVLCFALRAWPSLAASGAGRPLFPFFLVPQLVSIVRVILANFRHEAGHSLYTARRGAALVWPTCDHFTFLLCANPVFCCGELQQKWWLRKTGNNSFGVT